MIDTDTDNILLLADGDALEVLRSDYRLPQDILLEASIGDIWMRDFSPVRMSRQVGLSFLVCKFVTTTQLLLN